MIPKQDALFNNYLLFISAKDWWINYLHLTCTITARKDKCLVVDSPPRNHCYILDGCGRLHFFWTAHSERFLRPSAECLSLKKNDLQRIWELENVTHEVSNMLTSCVTRLSTIKGSITKRGSFQAGLKDKDNTTFPNSMSDIKKYLLFFVSLLHIVLHFFGDSMSIL